MKKFNKFIGWLSYFLSACVILGAIVLGVWYLVVYLFTQPLWVTIAVVVVLISAIIAFKLSSEE